MDFIKFPLHEAPQFLVVEPMLMGQLETVADHIYQLLRVVVLHEFEFLFDPDPIHIEPVLGVDLPLPILMGADVQQHRA